jgi:uncharacterized protein with HEPN domain
MRDERTYAFEMIHAARLIQAYLTGVTRDQFVRDRRTQDAVIWRLSVIGEAAKKIMRQTRDKLPNLPFGKMSRMRDRMIHTYWRIDPDVVWKTSTEDLQPLIDAISSIYPEVDSAERSAREENPGP